MGERGGELAGFEEGSAEPEMDIGVRRVRGEGLFEARDGFGGSGLPDQEFGIADGGFGVGIAAEGQGLFVLLFGGGEAAEGFEGFGAGETGAPVAGVGVFERGERFFEAVERVEGAGVEEAGVGDFVVELAGAAEGLLGVGIVFERGMRGARRLSTSGRFAGRLARRGRRRARPPRGRLCRREPRPDRSRRAGRERRTQVLQRFAATWGVG